MLRIKDWLNIKRNAQFKPILEGEMRKKHTIITAMRLSDDKKFTLGAIFFDTEFKINETETIFTSATIVDFKSDLINIEISCILTNSDFSIYYQEIYTCEINSIETTASTMSTMLKLKFFSENWKNKKD